MEQVNEESTAYLTVTFLDKDGNAAAPSSATYRIDCLTSGKAIRGVTALGAGSSVEVTLTPTDNAIQQVSSAKETRRVTIEALYGASDGINEEYDYEVVNLSHVS